MVGFSTRIVILFATGITLLSGGCTTPYDHQADEDRLAAILEAAVARETAGLEAEGGLETVPYPDSEVERSLSSRRAELDRLGPTRPGYP